VDWLIPAALGGVIDSRNAAKIKAKVIVEPRTIRYAGGRRNAEARRVTVIPDIIRTPAV